MILGEFAACVGACAAEVASDFHELILGPVRRKGMNTHTSSQSSLPLEEAPPDGRTFLNASVWFVDSDGYRVVFRWHEPIYRVALGDEVHLRLVAVALRQSKLVTCEEICRAFGHSAATQGRWERQYAQHGIDGLVSKKPSGRGRELDKSQEAVVRRWFHADYSNREMAKQLGVDEATIRRTLNRLGLARKTAAVVPLLPPVEEQAAEIAQAPTAAIESLDPATTETPSSPVVVSVPVPEPSAADPAVAVESPAMFTLDRDPHDRSNDRALARLGLLEDAAPLFADAACLPHAGVLLAVPLLVSHGLIETFAKVYHSIGPSFYGLRTIVVTLFLGALLRIKRPEHWKEHGPQGLARS